MTDAQLMKSTRNQTLNGTTMTELKRLKKDYPKDFKAMIMTEKELGIKLHRERFLLNAVTYNERVLHEHYMYGWDSIIEDGVSREVVRVFCILYTANRYKQETFVRNLIEKAK